MCENGCGTASATTAVAETVAPQSPWVVDLVLTISKLKRWSINYYIDTARAAETAGRDVARAGGGLGEYYSEHETRTPTWLLAGDTRTVATLVGLTDVQRAGGEAAGTFTTDGVRGMVNVESIGNVIVVQHYLTVRADSTHMEMVSKRSLVYLLHLIPTPVWVRWTMTAAALTKDTTTFSCTVETQMPPLVRLAATLSGFGYFLRKHVDEETVGFAADITRKLPGRTK